MRGKTGWVCPMASFVFRETLETGTLRLASPERGCLFARSETVSWLGVVALALPESVIPPRGSSTQKSFFLSDVTEFSLTALSKQPFFNGC